MSGCDGSGRLIGCPGCGVCEEEMAMIDAAKADALDALHALAFATRNRPESHTHTAPDADPWATPEEMR